MVDNKKEGNFGVSLGEIVNLFHNIRREKHQRIPQKEAAGSNVIYKLEMAEIIMDWADILELRSMVT